MLVDYTTVNAEKKIDRAELAFYTETKCAKDLSITCLVIND